MPDTPTNHPELLQPTEEAAWETFVAASRAWAAYLDQWDKFQFQTDYGPVYVSIGRAAEYPDSFDELPPSAMLVAGPFREG